MQQGPHFPATFVQLPPQCEGRRAAFYLAAEEYIACQLPPDSYFFTWQIGPTVVMGRNQVLHQEVNVDYCRSQGIDIIRRRSGGGAIYADDQNVMTSLITPEAPVESLFQEYAQAVAHALQQLGAPATVSGRNDIVIPVEGGNRKVCGNAFYKSAHRCIAHGTMLYDTDPVQMEAALHPHADKLQSKGVKSVRSRVGILRDYLPFPVAELRLRLRSLLCQRAVTLSDADVQHIESLELRYYQPRYFYGTSIHADVIRLSHIEGVGTLQISLRLQGSLIGAVELRGDYFALGPAQTALAKALVGQPFTPDAVRSALLLHHPERHIRGLQPADLLTLLFPPSVTP